MIIISENITILGCGRWGSFLAWYFSGRGFCVRLWGREGSQGFQQLVKNRSNEYLTLDPGIILTDDLEAAIGSSKRIIISISSQQLRDLMSRLSGFDLKGKDIILCMKGLEEETGKRLSEIAAEYVTDQTRIAIWVGPGHVQDFLRKNINCMVIDSYDEKLKIELVDAFSSGLIRFYYGTDMIGNEIGAASKNVIGIAAGMLDGMGLTSLKGALMSRGTREISRLIKAKGGNEMTAYGLAHLGDYEATVFSPHSHNRRFGELFAKGMKFDRLAEGVSTARAICRLAKECDVELPICNAVYNVLFDRQPPQQALSELFLRAQKFEF